MYDDSLSGSFSQHQNGHLESGCYSNPHFLDNPKLPNLTQGPQIDAPIPSYSWSLHRQNGDDPLIRDFMDTTRSYPPVN